jgi:hypothetical protein
MRRDSSRRLRRLASRDGALAVEAAAFLALARLAVIALPFRLLAPRLGLRRGETPASVTLHPAARRVGWAVGAVARRTPWRSECLEQAMAAKAMLRIRGIESTLYLGVTREPFAAHAWLRVGDLHVTGGRDVSRYAVVASFAEIGRG